MSWFLIAFLVIACAMFDRARGDKFDLIDRAAEQIMYGLAIAFCSGQFGWQSLVVAGLWWIGCSVGWGEPLGAFLDRRDMDYSNLQSWQFGPFATSPALALLLRGWIWGLPLLAAGYFIDWRWYFVAALMPLPVIGAPWIARATNWRWLAPSTWEQQEYYRGLLSGILVAGTFYV